MSDQSDVPAAEPEETAQDAATQQEESPHPWGDDFDAQRAWNKQQAQARELQELKERNRLLREDPEQFLEFASQHHRDLIAEEEAEREAADSDEGLEFEDDDPIAPLNEKLTRLEQWQQQQDSERERAAIQADIDAINTDSDWDLDDHDRAVIEAWARSSTKGKQFTRADLEQAHEKYIERLETIAVKAVERAKKPRPRPPHVTRGGTPATETKNVTDMTRRELDAYMLERAQANTA